MFKTQDRVFLKFEPALRGTVTKVLPGGKFSVTWDDHSRKRGTPRTRFSYDERALASIKLVGSVEKKEDSDA